MIFLFFLFWECSWYSFHRYCCIDKLACYNEFFSLLKLSKYKCQCTLRLGIRSILINYRFIRAKVMHLLRCQTLLIQTFRLTLACDSKLYCNLRHKISIYFSNVIRARNLIPLVCLFLQPFQSAISNLKFGKKISPYHLKIFCYLQ